MGVMAGKVCVITGGAGSLGLATARLLLSEGGQILLIDLDGERLQKAAAALGDGVSTVVADVTKSEEVERLAAAASGRWGAIDVLISNAGNFGVVEPIASYPDGVFDSVYAVHVKGAFLCCKHCVPKMRDGGSIVIVSSVAATRGDPGVYAYITAKHAQVGLMRCLAKELAPRRIRVNTIHPGPIDNDFQHRVENDLGRIIGTDGHAFFNRMIPLGRHGEPDEIARSILFLSSDASSFVTGATLMVDGGMSV